MEKKQAPKSNSVDINSPHILIVGDAYPWLRSLEKILQKEDYPYVVSSAENEALKLLSNTFIRVVIFQGSKENKSLEFIALVKKQDPLVECLFIVPNQDASVIEGVEAIIFPLPWEELTFRQILLQAYKKATLAKKHQALIDWLDFLSGPLPISLNKVPRPLLLVKDIQEKILGAGEKPNVLGLEVETLFIPCEKNQSDFFEFYSASRRNLDIVIGHVKEQGLTAVLAAALLKKDVSHYLQPISLPKVYIKSEGWKEYQVSLEEIFDLLERTIGELFHHLNILASLTIGRIDLVNQTFSYVNYGNPVGIVYKAKLNKIIYLKHQNHFIGNARHSLCQVHDFHYEQDDIFVFYSAGMRTEDVSYLLDLLYECRDVELKTFIRKFTDYLRGTVGILDVTLIAMKMNPKEVHAPLVVFFSTFKSTIKELENARNFAQKLCQNIPGDQEILTYYLHLVINEIFCNIVEHGYMNNPEGLIIIQGSHGKEGVTLEIYDQGNSYDPSEVPEPVTSGEVERGFGLYIVKEVVDQLTYIKKASPKGWNQLRIFKKFCAGDAIMDLNHTFANDVLIIAPNLTSLDAKHAAEFKEKVIQLITENEANHVVLDLNQVQFIDSSGLGSFLSILRLLHAQGGDLKLSRIHRPIRTMFELVAMNKIFDIHEQTEDAIAAFTNN